ncbi:hypothetical protein JVX92_08590 [Microbacterium hominis]|uniref:hypothetical protein n=1 Tax=Microbacterium hominis TaxID=162426 RepID=UPI001965B975|nr:hypothetical protein [Microbacterium hominis]QRY39610.1 hypothetical protein JVX92_08590 [Microbacterium hominis]
MDAKTRVPGRKRLLIAGGALLGDAGLVTAATFTDFANLNPGNGTDDSGIGGDNRFNIQVVGTDADGNPVAGTWQEANTEAGVTINVPGSQPITPGDTVSVAIPFRNESPALSADISFSLQDRPRYTSDPAMVAALRYMITLDSTDIVTDAMQATVDDLDFGTDLTGEQGTLEVATTLPDQGSVADNNALQGQVSYAQAPFDAISVQP